SAKSSRLSGDLLPLVVGNRLFQIAVLVAGEKAQLVEYREVLLRLGEIADHQVGLAEILVRAPVIGIDAQRLVVMLEDEAHVGVRTPADRVGVEIVVVGIVGISCKRLTQGGLRRPSEAARAEAVNWIANRGAMADAPLLHERLRDDSETVREFAEQGLWLLWGRSGDDEIDRRMARGTGEMQAGRLADSVATF